MTGLAREVLHDKKEEAFAEGFGGGILLRRSKKAAAFSDQALYRNCERLLTSRRFAQKVDVSI